MINLDKIQELKELEYENGTLFHFLFHLFVKDCEIFRSKIDIIFNNKEYNKLFNEIHYLKNSCLNIGATDPGNICDIICRDIEKDKIIGFEQIEDLKLSLHLAIKNLEELI